MTDANQKIHIGGVNPEKQRCLRCGAWYLDTGWECNDCGYDNMPHYAKRVPCPTCSAPTVKTQVAGAFEMSDVYHYLSHREQSR